MLIMLLAADVYIKRTATEYGAIVVRTISVKEAAQALGISTRAVIYRIEKGELKGEQKPNPYGVREWRIYPTKEIAEKLRLKESGDNGIFNESGEPETIDAEPVTEADPVSETADGFWVDSESSRFRLVVDEISRPLLQTIREQEREITEQRRELRLLPDLRKQAETERKASEEKALEAEALRKQIAAIEEKRELEIGALAEQVSSLREKLERSQNTWWRRFFIGGAG
jgi:transposase